MKEYEKTNAAGSFFKSLFGNLIVFIFIAACVYKGIDKFKNLSDVAERSITRFLINVEWIDIILYFCLAILLIILVVYVDVTKFQKRSRDKKIRNLEETIEDLKCCKKENVSNITENETDEEKV